MSYLDYGYNQFLQKTTAQDGLGISGLYSSPIGAGNAHDRGEMEGFFPGLGASLVGDTLQSSNWDTTRGSFYDLNDGTFKLGGSASPKLSWNGSTLAINGSVTATTGTIGGWSIGATALTAGSAGTTVGLDSGGTNPALYAGSATPGSAPFRVTNAGALTATSGAIGGWTIGSNALYTGTEDHSGYTTNAGDVTIYSDGSNASIHAKNFYIDADGNIFATNGTFSGTVTGSTITGSTLKTGDAGANVYLASDQLIIRYDTTATTGYFIGSADGNSTLRTSALIIYNSSGTGGTFAGGVAGGVTLNNDFLSSTGGGNNLGNATYYWNDVSYKTLTDRGCLGWFDEGVEIQDGSVVSDTEALLAIEKDEEKTTIYGKQMLKYSTFPKVSFKPAQNEKEAEGIEMTSMFSIMIGAIRELTNRVKELEARPIIT